jgi:hypothetical protein
MNTFIDISDPAKEYFQRANTGVSGLQDPSTTLLPIYQLQSHILEDHSLNFYFHENLKWGHTNLGSLLLSVFALLHLLGFNSS